MFNKNPYLRTLAIVAYVFGAIGLVIAFFGIASSTSGGAEAAAFGGVLIGVGLLAWFLNLVAAAIAWKPSDD